MSVKFEHDGEKNIGYAVITGSFTIADIELVISTFAESDDYQSDLNTIWDLREIDLTGIDRTFVNSIVSMREKYPQRGSARIALIADTDLVFGMSRMYETLGEHLPQEVKAVRTSEEAEAWVLEKQ